MRVIELAIMRYYSKMDADKFKQIEIVGQQLDEQNRRNW